MKFYIDGFSWKTMAELNERLLQEGYEGVSSWMRPGSTVEWPPVRDVDDLKEADICIFVSGDHLHVSPRFAMFGVAHRNEKMIIVVGAFDPGDRGLMDMTDVYRVDTPEEVVSLMAKFKTLDDVPVSATDTGVTRFLKRAYQILPVERGRHAISLNPDNGMLEFSFVAEGNENPTLLQISNDRAFWKAESLADDIKELLEKNREIDRQASESDYQQAIEKLKVICEKYGDTNWDEDTPLSEIIENHLGNHLEKNAVLLTGTTAEAQVDGQYPEAESKE